MKKVILLVMFSLFFISCAHTVKKESSLTKADCTCDANLEHAFDKQCAHAVSQGKFDIKGHKDFTIKHLGNIYYFSSEAKKKAFLKNIDKNVQAARANWSQRLR